LQALPSVLQESFLNKKNSFEESLQTIDLNWHKFISQFKDSYPDLESHLIKTITFSDFVFDNILRQPNILVELLQTKELINRREKGYYLKVLSELCETQPDQNAWMKSLRQFRLREMVRYVWREANALSETREAMCEYSEFASAAIDVSLDFLYQQQINLLGTPKSKVDQSPQKLSVLGMGKLGGGELNLSSDIDLIFFYKDAGKTDGLRAIDNQQFFVKLAQQLIRVLDERTVDGFVFRVDMRLRPYGDSGLLVLNQNAMELYYETQGRTWERYAFIKAAWVAGDRGVAEKFLENIKPFMYRKYVDFTVVESLREMKLLINRQVKTKGLENDIKLGEGGIRELEFIVQALQLIKGGRKTTLQLKSYYLAMQEVSRLELMQAEEVEKLINIYSFYRRLEHLVQGRADQQTQMLPNIVEHQEALAWLLGYENFSSLDNKIAESRLYVREIFDDLFSSSAASENESAELGAYKPERYITLWLHIVEQPVVFDGLDELVQQAINEQLLDFSQENILLKISEIEKKRLDLCMAYLIYRIQDFKEPAELLNQAIKFFRTILKRSAYLVLLYENQKVFYFLLSLFQRSQWILDNLLQHPFLLDELLQLQSKKNLKDAQTIKAELHQLSLRTDAHGLEVQLEELRVFKCTYEIQAAALYLDKHISTSELGDFLSALAQSLLQEVSRIAVKEILKLTKDAEQVSIEKDFLENSFAIVAYGKLGSQELGFGSDLDLVFVFDDANKKLSDTGRLLTRFGQKIIHLLNARTYSGILYEADMRLRPSGKSGQLVSSLSAFEKYQAESAWVWEHQALVKARVVVGSEAMQSRFNAIRHQTLRTKRAEAELLKEVVDMRKRLQENFTSLANEFHLKTDEGGIVDIEFLAQFLVLSHSNRYQKLSECHATLEIFEFVSQHESICPEWLIGLKNIYLLFRQQINELTLAQQKVFIQSTQLQAERAQVAEVWLKLISDLAIHED
jgi:glutamate-ammonia-ligase adenylyltransferase